MDANAMPINLSATQTWKKSSNNAIHHKTNPIFDRPLNSPTKIEEKNCRDKKWKFVLANSIFLFFFLWARHGYFRGGYAYSSMGVHGKGWVLPYESVMFKWSLRRVQSWKVVEEEKVKGDWVKSDKTCDVLSQQRTGICSQAISMLLSSRGEGRVNTGDRRFVVYLWVEQ